MAMMIRISKPGMVSPTSTTTLITLSIQPP